MASSKKSRRQLQTEFEQFFHNGEWDLLLDTAIIPDSALTFPSAGPRVPEDMSWDRRAAWLLFSARGRYQSTSRIPEGPVEFLM